MTDLVVEEPDSSKPEPPAVATKGSEWSARMHEKRREAKRVADAAEQAASSVADKVQDGLSTGVVLQDSDTALVLKALRDIVRSKKAPENARVAAGQALLRYESDSSKGEGEAPSVMSEWRRTLALLPPLDRLAVLRSLMYPEAEATPSSEGAEVHPPMATQG